MSAYGWWMPSTGSCWADRLIWQMAGVYFLVHNIFVASKLDLANYILV